MRVRSLHLEVANVDQRSLQRRAAYRRAFMDGDTENTGVGFGKAAGLVHSIEPAGLIVQRMRARHWLGAMASSMSSSNIARHALA